MRINIKFFHFCCAAVCGLFFCSAASSAAERTIYTSPYVSVSEDGRAWTTNSGDKDVKWYSEGETVETGIPSSLRGLETGEHYYLTLRQGSVPIGYWKVKWEKGQCIHNSYPSDTDTFHGIPFGRKVCQKKHYSGWIPYCADCGGSVSNMLFYMSREAAESIDYLVMEEGMDYYYLCPFCSNMEQGGGLFGHSCKAVSYNQYQVRYEANCDHYGGYMGNSIHMYGNADTYEGKPVTPMTHLALNKYVREGYLFDGWNSEPDGSGTAYRDGESIWNLTDSDYHINEEEGTIVLYAQWKAVESTLYIDPNGGSYNGNQDTTAVTQAYGTVFKVEEGLVEPPAGHRVSFECNGGSAVADITGTMHFTEWKQDMPFYGRFQDGLYYYESSGGESDALTACYEYDSMVLPVTEKPGSSFGGWYYDTGFEVPAGAAGDRITPVKDMTLYAQWGDLTLYAKENYQTGGGKGAVDLTWSLKDPKNKWYLLYQSTDGKTWNRIFGKEDIGTDKTVIFSDLYDGSSKTYTVEHTGLYTLTAAGAQGGGYGGFSGGKGGSVTASFWLKRGEVLTYTVGGANGYNGGGEGNKYADGGGCTTITSDQKGMLLAAGGGGGATDAGDGGAGGSQTGLLSSGYHGESGDAGGGGGYRGGMAGERTIHHHTDSCFLDTSYNGLDRAVFYRGDDIHVKVNHDEEASECSECYQYSLERAGNRANPIPVIGNTTVRVQAVLWKQICLGGELWKDSYLKVYDQNGNCFLEQDLSNILHNSSVLRNELINRQYKVWEQNGENLRFPLFHTEFVWELPEKDEEDEDNGGYTRYWSVRNDDGTSEIMGQYKRDADAPIVQLWGKSGSMNYPLFPERRFQEFGDTGYRLENIPLFFVRKAGCNESGVLLDYVIDIPEGVTGFYVEAYAKGRSAHSHDLVNARILDIMLQGGKKVICGMTEGQILSSKPAYGGSSYVNEEYAYSFTRQAGIQEGDGSFSLRSADVGYVEEHNLEGVMAPDMAPPDPVDGRLIQKEGLAAGKVLVTWEEPTDHGTEYYHVAESYFAGDGAVLCRSNETVNTLTSGVKGYYYCVDENSDTRVTSISVYTEQRSVTVTVGEKTCYLHLAAVDVAENISDTIHIPLDVDAAARPLHTERLSIETSGENVYPAGGGKWYVRSDGVTPFSLRYSGYIDGAATGLYQINHADFVSIGQGGQISSCHRVSAGNQELSSGRINIPENLLNLSSENASILSYYPYTQAYRDEGNRRLTVIQTFTMDKAASGRQTEIYPRAGADWAGGIYYSAQEEDVQHGLTLIGDGEPPVIRGMETLRNLSLIDRRENTLLLNLTAEDELSGVGEFYLMVYNTDNNCSRRFDPDESGLIQVELTAEDPLFSGDFTAAAYAIDNVGNETSVSEETTEFGLAARIERILSPHDPVFQNGESGILSIGVWGYPDYVEIEFPAEMTEQNPELNHRIEYTDSPRYCQEEEIQFMIPLYTPANADYTITVRAYKGGKQLEQYPELSIVEVGGTVLDDFRTRLR